MTLFVFGLNYKPTILNFPAYLTKGGMWWCSWLRQCATSRKVVDSIPDRVTGFFIDLGRLSL
jgi:hypothetical protein